ncbi:MAG TPA: hypothetical protein VM597_24660 [Gemmataceae bacterium]|nr:hypothetical protein [Gemmataceae bacterium]
MTLGKEEEVEVPAGKFRAIPVTSDSTRAGQTVKVTSRYAPKIGMVKSEAVINGITTTHVLKSFTSGK